MSRRGRTIKPQKKDRIRQLLAIYGDLLTRKQRYYVHSHYVEDLTFKEIASRAGVSRQAVHDVAKYAEVELEKYEKCLAVLKQRTQGEPSPSEKKRIKEVLDRLRSKIQRQRVIYNIDWLLRDIDRLLKALEKS